MTVDEALRAADVAKRVQEQCKLRPSMARFNGEAAIVLAAEVRRLRHETFELVKDLCAGTPEGNRNR